MVYCWSCGTERHESPDPCARCGASQVVRSDDAPAHLVSVCAGCGYAGEGTRYFSRAGHAFLLALVSLVTYGIGGLVYWLIKRHALICPSCGVSWERANALPGTRVVTSSGRGRSAAIHSNGATASLPWGGLVRRIVGIVIVGASVGLVSIGIVVSEPVVVVVGSVGGLLGAGAYVWGRAAAGTRREALVRSLQGSVLHCARLRGGALTVTDVASDVGLTLMGAERLLSSMEDGFRVRSEVTRDGLIVYRFPEIVARQEPRSPRTLEAEIEGPAARDLLGVGRRSAAS